MDFWFSLATVAPEEWLASMMSTAGAMESDFNGSDGVECWSVGRFSIIVRVACRASGFFLGLMEDSAEKWSNLNRQEPTDSRSSALYGSSIRVTKIRGF